MLKIFFCASITIVKTNIGDKTIAYNDNRNNRNQAIMNERIRSREVRLIDQNGENQGVIATSKALQMAYDADLDLVLINPNQDPPVAKILNYGKYKYELEKKAKEAKKKQHTVDVKEIKIRYKIDTHDYQVRIKSLEKFIAQEGARGLMERAELTLSNTIELSRNIDLPIMTATAINPTTAPFAFAAGASAIGCGSCINKMDSDLSMMATARSLVEIASRNALKVVELV